MLEIVLHLSGYLKENVNIDTIFFVSKGLGFAGDRISVNKDLARHKLIPLGAAFYNTPENAKKVAEIAKVTKYRSLKV